MNCKIVQFGGPPDLIITPIQKTSQVMVNFVPSEVLRTGLSPLLSYNRPYPHPSHPIPPIVSISTPAIPCPAPSSSPHLKPTSSSASQPLNLSIPGSTSGSAVTVATIRFPKYSISTLSPSSTPLFNHPYAIGLPTVYPKAAEVM